MPCVEVEGFGVAVCGDEGDIWTADGVGCEVFNCRVGSFDPSELFLFFC